MVAFQESRRFGSEGHDHETVVDTMADSSTCKRDIQTKARIYSTESLLLLCCRCMNSLREVVRHAFGCPFRPPKACVDLKNMSIFVESSTLDTVAEVDQPCLEKRPCFVKLRCMSRCSSCQTHLTKEIWISSDRCEWLDLYWLVWLCVVRLWWHLRNNCVFERE